MCFTCGFVEVCGPLLGCGRLRRTGAGCTLFCLLRPAPGYGKGELGAPHVEEKKQRLARRVVWVAWSRLGGSRDSAEPVVDTESRRSYW